MRRLVPVVVLLAAVVIVPVVLAAGNGGTVSVQLKEFKVTPKPATVKAGKVTFKVKNVGKLMHEMVVVRTNLAPAKLALKNGEASEKGAVGEVPDVPAGKSGMITLTLKVGKYVLLCNLPGHFKAGQYVRFVVK